MNRMLATAIAIIVGAVLLVWAIAPAVEAQGSGAPVAEASSAKSAGGHARGTRRAAGDGAGGEDAIVIPRDHSGQFSLTAQVNGEDMDFLVDTGADVVALTVSDAEALGLDADPENFEPIGQTASGTGYGARVRIDRMEIGGEHFDDVEAVVVDGLTTNLLGQSVLRRLGRMELRGDRMVIHPST